MEEGLQVKFIKNIYITTYEIWWNTSLCSFKIYKEEII